jgi:type II secretion system protein L
VDTNNYVGIYLSADHAVVVGVHVKGQDCRISGAFVTSVDPKSEERVQLLARQIAEGCAENKLKAEEAVVALDCALTMQHTVHSEFQQVKQIAATVRFDTEEVLATDVSNLGVAFQMERQDEKGSQLNVFTAEQKVLSEWLLALQSHGIDPVAVVPDICCLGRTIQNYADPSASDTLQLYCVLSQRHGYFVKHNQGKITPVRALMVSPRANRTDLMQREVFTTLASMGEHTERTLRVFDVQDQVDTEQLQERLGMDTDRMDWFRTHGAGPQAQADEADPVDYAIAMGAALLKGERGNVADFRNDFMPFQGRRMRVQSALRWASVSVTLLLLALGAYLQIRVLLVQRDRDRIWQWIAEQYSIAMPGKELAKLQNPIAKLKSEVRRLEATQGGGSTGDLLSVPDRLTAILTAFNTVAGKTDLRIDNLDITEKTIVLTGDTTNNTSNLQFQQGLRDTGMEIMRDNHSTDPASNRLKFTITIEPRRNKAS